MTNESVDDFISKIQAKKPKKRETLREKEKRAKENLKSIESQVKAAGYNNYKDYIINNSEEGGYGAYGDSGKEYLNLLTDDELKMVASRIYLGVQESRRSRAELGMMFSGYGPSAESKFAERERLAEEKKKAEIQAKEDARNKEWTDRVRAMNAAADEADARRDREHQMYLQGKNASENNNSKYIPSQRTKDLLASNPKLNSDFIAVGEEGDKHIIPVSYLNHNKGGY